MWTSEYRPNTLSDVIGNEDSVSEIREWGSTWSVDEPAIIIYGPPGVGKTSSAHALADEMHWEILEMNASDKRTKNIVKSIAGESSKTATLSESKRKLIIIDEADNLHGHSDRGGKKAITEVIKESRQPIVLIANDFYDLSRSLRNKVKSVEFDRVSNSELARKLRDICESENVEYDIDALKQIAKNADGDIRGAINDLQKYGVDGTVSSGELDQTPRDKKEEIFPFMDAVLKEKGPRQVRNSSENLDMTPYDLYQWIEQNLYYEYDTNELSEGVKELSRAAHWLGVVNQTQNYKYWRYTNDRLTAGISSKRNGSHSGWTRWQPPRYGGSSSVDDDVLETIINRNNVSRNTVKEEIHPYLSEMIEYCKPEDMTAEIAAWFDWDVSEISSVTGSGESTNKVGRVANKSDEIQTDFDPTEDVSEKGGFERSIDEDKYQESEDGEEEDVNDGQEENGDIEISEDSKSEDEDQTGLEDFM